MPISIHYKTADNSAGSSLYEDYQTAVCEYILKLGGALFKA